MAIYRSSRGTPIDLDALRMKSESSISVGNTKTNARGDALGKGGKIEKSADEIAREHYNKNNPRAVKKASIKIDDDKPSKNKIKQEEVLDNLSELEQKLEEPAIEEPQDDWVEDEDGNFVKKEDE